MLERIPSISADRIESLKAGAMAALATTITYGLIQLVYLLLPTPIASQITIPLSNPASLPLLLISVGTVVLSGAMFGITYRYAIRQDANPHLSAGVVTAFGLVRGLAHLDEPLLLQTGSNGIQLWEPLALAIAPIIESVLLFAVARLILDWAIHHHRLQTLP